MQKLTHAKSHQPLVAGWLRTTDCSDTLPSFLGRVYPSPYPLPGPWPGAPGIGRWVLERLFGYLGGLLFFITFSMPFWIDFCSIRIAALRRFG